MSRKVVLGAVVSAVVASSVGALMLTNSKTVSADETKTVVSSAKNELSAALLDETVYVFLNADGEVKKTISSDWTKNDLGTDVYTKTEGKVSTPVTMKISYYLDGQKVSADEIRGRSGHVKIRYDYTNNERVNGMYMPYAVVSGAVLSDEHFSNISVTNGKAINDGTRTTIVGLALPGMKEDLGVALGLPEYIEIEADAKDFKMEMTATLASSQIFANVDTSALNSVASLSSQLELLASSMNQLLNGSVQIRDGLATLNSKTGALVDGVSQLQAGSLKLANGTSALSEGLGTAYAGSKELASGLSEAYEGSKALTAGVAGAYDGAKKIDVGVDQLITSMNELAGGFTILNKDNANTKLISGATQFFNGTIAALQAQGATTITAENYETVLAALIQDYTTAGNAEMVEKMSTSLAQLRLYSGVIAYISGVNQIAAGAASAPAKVAPLKEGTSALASGLSQMNIKVPALSEGLSKLSTGATNLSNGLADAYTGSKEIATGTTSLNAGISNLAGNIPALTDGVSKLANGSSSLTDGLVQFNEQGIQKLVSLYNGNVKALIERIQTIVNLAKNSDSKTKYIYRTSEI